MHAAGALARPARDGGGALMEPFIRPIAIGVMIFVVFNLLIMASAVLVLAERKIMGFMQQRYGPYLVGPHGMLQPIADILKLIFKEELRPKGADKWLFTLAPVLSIVAAFVAFATVPYGAETTLFGLLDEPIKLGIADVNVAVLVVFAVTSMGVYGIVLAGWSSNSKYSLFGGLRASAQMISYELSYATSLAAVILLAGSLSLREVVDSQTGTWLGVLPQWYIFLQPIGFIIYVIAGVAETNRAPFDFPEAEQELVAGYNTEYSSVRFALFPQAEYINMVTMSAVATDLYLGGWHGLLPFYTPLDPLIEQYGLGWLVFLAKVAGFLFVYIWMRWTVPRYRYDQLMMFGWKYLFPASVLNLIVTAALVLYFNA
jgi:NADH-quinone oxidoreductase subunit H